MFANLINAAQALGREMSDMNRLFVPENKELRTLVFYAESPIFYRYYEDYLNFIKENSSLRICYLCSDPDDPLFQIKDERIVPFYINKTLSAVFSRLDCKALVMGTPDLSKGVVKRAPAPVHHVYAFRGISSTHLAYRHGALDNYDSVLCVAQYQIDELRKAEELYTTPEKQMILTGYPLLERIWRDHRAWLEQRTQGNAQPICLIAPSWAPLNPEASILDNCIEGMIASLSGKKLTVWLRPHPEYARRFSKRLMEIEKLCAATDNVRLQMELGSMQCLHQADVLVTDHSSISVDFALGTERQVLFIDTPTRIDNPRWEEIGMEPGELLLRDQLGARLHPSQVERTAEIVEALLNTSDEFKARLPSLRDKLVANWQKADRVGGEHIINLCRKGA
jgi:YidC/Oxa1 family membrane protein insertase